MRIGGLVGKSVLKYARGHCPNAIVEAADVLIRRVSPADGLQARGVSPTGVQSTQRGWLSKKLVAHDGTRKQRM